jgi:large repetitive protein
VQFRAWSTVLAVSAGVAGGCGGTEAPDPVAPLSIVRSPLPLAGVDEPYVARVSTRGGTEPVLDWQLRQGNLPPGTELRPAPPRSVEILGLPERSGLYGFLLLATDAAGDVASSRVRITVDEPPPALEVRAARIPSEPRLESLYVASFEALGGSGNGYRWTTDDGLPSGLRLEPLGPQLTVVGQPQSAGPYEFVVVCIDAAGQQAALRVSGEIGFPPLELEAAELPPASLGVRYTATLRARGGDGGPYRWSVGDRAPPAGMRLDIDATGPTTTLSGAPQRLGTSTFEVAVADGTGTETRQTFTLTTFDGVPPLFVSTVRLENGAQTRPYRSKIRAQGGTPPLSWKIVGGRLPRGLELASNGGPLAEVWGTPTERGTFEVQIEVEDAVGNVAARTYPMFVDGAPLRIETASLPPARYARPYRGALKTANAPTGGLAWYVIDGALPPGVLLPSTGSPDNALMGVPERPGLFEFTVAVSSVEDDAFDVRTLTLEVFQ